MKKAAPHRHAPFVRPAKAPHDEVFVRAAAVFRAAGDVSRLRLLHRLSRGESCVSELAAEASTKLSTLSQQLRVLHSERIVAKRRDGKHIYYRLADEHVKQLVAMVLEHAAH